MLYRGRLHVEAQIEHVLQGFPGPSARQVGPLREEALLREAALCFLDHQAIELVIIKWTARPTFYASLSIIQQ